MPRPLQFTAERIVELALPVLWSEGYGATSIADLVERTAVSRQVLYGSFDDKRALLLACLDLYGATVVDPAFCPVEADGAGLAAIARYFETQIAEAESAGSPGWGCLIANLSTELAPHDPEVAALVRTHLARLRRGFASALAHAVGPRHADKVEGWAGLLATTAQGLWSVSRVDPDPDALRRTVAALIGLIEGAVAS